MVSARHKATPAFGWKPSGRGGCRGRRNSLVFTRQGLGLVACTRVADWCYAWLAPAGMQLDVHGPPKQGADAPGCHNWRWVRRGTNRSLRLVMGSQSLQRSTKLVVRSQPGGDPSSCGTSSEQVSALSTQERAEKRSVRNKR